MSFGAEAEEDEEEVDIATEVNFGVVMALNCSCHNLETTRIPIRKASGTLKKKFKMKTSSSTSLCGTREPFCQSGNIFIVDNYHINM